jgi:predicted nucleic acid-binding protein
VRCLDTPLLEDLLQGRSRVQRWLPRLEGGGEVVTTEVNLLELGLAARRLGPKGLEGRLRALETLRKEVTVLPVTAEAVRQTIPVTEVKTGRGKRPRLPHPSESSLLGLVVGVALAHGVGEIWTNRSRALPEGNRKVKVRRFS